MCVYDDCLDGKTFPASSEVTAEVDVKNYGNRFGRQPVTKLQNKSSPTVSITSRQNTALALVRPVQIESEI